MNEKEILQYYKDCQTIFNHYGMQSQKYQFIQELSELILAITKNDPVNFVEEVADVQVMIDQFMLSNPVIDQEVEKIQFAKVKRQLQRIKEEKENENAA